jgi:Dolichyl-phosphate-mannose-protein mannosyltransferase
MNDTTTADPQTQGADHPSGGSGISAGSSGHLTRITSRFGRTSLIILAAIVLIGFGLRMDRVVNPLATPGDDALAYRALAQSLYEDKSYGGPNFDTPSDWSPGAPLIYAGAYYVTGGVRDGVARGVEAIFGTLAIILAYLLAFRLSRRRAAPLIAAALVAVYPPFIHSTGALMSEPPAIFTLPAAVLAFWWADSRDDWWPWILPGLLLGATSMIRPEYMVVAALFGVFLLIRGWIKRGPRPTILACIAFGLAVLVPIVPWTIRNHNDLGRWVPISTGSGKALYVGSNLPADGDYKRVKANLYEEQKGISLDPDSAALDKVNPVPLFNVVANDYRAKENLPDLTRDQALGRKGKENLKHYIRTEPLSYTGMTVRKVGRMWGTGVGEAMSSTLGATIQKLLVLAGLAGLIMLAWRRRWEAISLAIPILTVTAVGAATLAPARRNEILMTLVLPLAAVALAEAVGWISERSTASSSDSAPKPPPSSAKPQTP